MNIQRIRRIAGAVSYFAGLCLAVYGGVYDNTALAVTGVALLIVGYVEANRT